MIARCTPDDTARICEIINAGAEAYRGVIPPDCWHDPYMSIEALRSEIDAGVSFAGYSTSGSMVGAMGSQFVVDITLIRHAYVLPEHQHRGIGRALLDHLLSRISGDVLVGTWSDATWALRFYERNGFRRLTAEDSRRLLERYWTVPERQMESSSVLVLSDRSSLSIPPMSSDRPQPSAVSPDDSGE